MGKLRILDRPFSLQARALAVGIKSHVQSGDLDGFIVASFEHLKLIEYHRQHPKSKARLVWAILDGFYSLSDSFRSIIDLPELSIIDDILVVGDCGSINHLRLLTGRQDLRLLLGAKGASNLIKDLCSANPFVRLNHHIPPARCYEAWDALKDPGAKRPRAEGRDLLFFAGNDGLIGISNVFSAIGIQDLSNYSQNVNPVSFQEQLRSGLRANASLSELMEYGYKYFTDLAVFLDGILDKFNNNQSSDYIITRKSCLEAILSKSVSRHAILSWIQHTGLGVVITNPRMNKNYYAYQHFTGFKMLDLGGLNGFEEIYPRRLDCMLYGKDVVSVNSNIKELYSCHSRRDPSALSKGCRSLEARIFQSLIGDTTSYQ